MAIRTVEDAIRSLPTHDKIGRKHNTSDSQSKTKLVIEGLATLAANGHFTPKAGERVLQAARMSMTAADRLINLFPDIYQKTGNFDTYSRLCLDALKQFGYQAGSSFIWSYGQMQNQGINPEDYFRDIGVAVDVGGKLFGGMFARTLPDVLKAGGKTQEFRSHSLRINRLGGLNIARPFIFNAAKMYKDQDRKIEDYSAATIDALEGFGPDTKGVYHFVENMVPLNNRFGYDPARFLSDSKEVYQVGYETGRGDEQKAARAVKWFTRGMGGFVYAAKCLEAKTTHLQGIMKTESWFDFDGAEEKRAAKLVALNQLSEHAQRVSPDGFKEHYLRLLRDTNQTGATFLSELVQSPYKRLNLNQFDLQVRDEPLVSLSIYPDLPDRLIELFHQVNKKTFNTAARFIPRTFIDDPILLFILSNIAKDYTNLGSEQVVNAIKYTWGCSRRGIDTKGLEYPVASQDRVNDSHLSPPSDEEFAHLDDRYFKDDSPAFDSIGDLDVF